MRVLGIDPGTTVTAYGVVERQRGRLLYVDSGHVRTSPYDPLGERLAAIHATLLEAIRRHAPDAVAIEAIFHHKNALSALRLGHARGVALLAAGQCGYAPFEYNPMVVKQTVGATGKADKKVVARMVAMLLGAPVEGPADVTDALAIALTHCAHARAHALRAMP
jgi:crossover junction endodeoxyribonuclease RuvC